MHVAHVEVQHIDPRGVLPPADIVRVEQCLRRRISVWISERPDGNLRMLQFGKEGFMNLLQAIACTRGGLDSQILFWFDVTPTTILPVLKAWYTIHAGFPLVAACFLVPRRGKSL